jgi:hypothetical protein
VRDFRQLAATVVILAAYGAYAYWIALDAEDRKFGIDAYFSKKQALLQKLFGPKVVLSGAD